MPSVALYPQADLSNKTIEVQEQEPLKISLQSYYDVLNLIDDLESGELEKKCSQADLEKINYFLANLATQGVLPNEAEEEFVLKNDIQELLYEDANLYDYAFSMGQGSDYILVPAIFHTHGEIVLCKSWIEKKWKQTKKFAKKHKKALIIGAVVMVVAVVVVGVVAASSAGAAAGAAAGGGDKDEKEKDQSKTEEERLSASSSTPPVEPLPAMSATSETPILASVIEEYISAFKENIAQNQFFQSTNPAIGQQGLSWEENGRALGSLFAHDSYNNIQNQISYHPRLAQEIEDINRNYTFPIPDGYQDFSSAHPEIDRKFSTNYTPLYSNSGQEADFNTLSHQVRGERALAFGYYNQAIQDLGKAIETNPTNPLPYLERGIAHFGLGQYDRSLEDYRQFTAQAQAHKCDQLSIPEFSLGVAKGLPRGVYESGKGFFLFMTDLVKCPIQTSGQIFDSVTTLVHLVRNDEWGVVAEALSPEMHQLVTQWDTLSSEKKGELAGYAVGKHGADILAPGALLKVASKSIKSAQELAAICKNIQIAQETLVLETAAEIGNGAKIAEVVGTGQKMTFLGEELGFTAQEMGQLKQTGKLGGAINSGLEKLVSQSESEVYKAAISQNKHVKMVRDYLDKPAKEIQKGVNSYEKQIALHKDKIANPVKHCPDWDKLDPRQREALVNKKWPVEIRIYEEQKSVLQSILNERLSHE